MTNIRRRSERLARALEDQKGAAEDPATSRAVRAAQALTPNLAPRESWRSACKDRMLREAQRANSAPRADAGTRDGAYTDAVHSATVETSAQGRAVLADVEEISDERAREVAEKLAQIARAFAGEGRGRGHQ